MMWFIAQYRVGCCAAVVLFLALQGVVLCMVKMCIVKHIMLRGVLSCSLYSGGNDSTYTRVSLHTETVHTHCTLHTHTRCICCIHPHTAHYTKHRGAPQPHHQVHSLSLPLQALVGSAVPGNHHCVCVVFHLIHIPLCTTAQPGVLCSWGMVVFLGHGCGMLHVGLPLLQRVAL